ncbi:MAG: clostripain-related cysteine peptidase [Candidatus Sericytochromatia bacterium]
MINKKLVLNTSVALAMVLSACNLKQVNNIPDSTKTNGMFSNVDKSKLGNVVLTINTPPVKYQDSFNTKAIDFTNTAIKQLRLEITGSGISKAVTQTISWAPNQPAVFNLTVLAGSNRVLTLSSLDANGNVLGSLMGALDVTAGQNNAGSVSYFDTSIAQVLSNILASNNPNLLNNLSLTSIKNYIKTVTGFNEATNKFSNFSPVTFNSKAVSDYILANNGTLPPTNLANLNATGSLTLNLNLLGAKVMINDPNSSTFNNTTNKSTTINGITPGRWLLSVTKAGYSPSNSMIDVSTTGVVKTISLSTGSGRGGGGDTSGKDETGTLGNDSSAPIGTGTKTLFAIYLLGSDLEDEHQKLIDNKWTKVVSEVDSGAITVSGTTVTNGTGPVAKTGAGTKDLNELTNALKAMTPAERANVDIIVGFGGARKQGWKGIKYANADCLITDSADAYYGNSNCYNKADEAANMGQGATLGDFVTYVKDTFPAANYGKRIMTLWDHGGAHAGYGPDSITGTSMTLKEINDALAKDPIKYDMVGFDTCLMGNLDLAKFVQKRANYLLASEELEPGHGWQYTEVINYIAKNPNATIVDIGKAMVDSFITSQDHSSSDGKTLSLADLSKLDAVYSALDTFATNAQTSLTANLGMLSQAMEKAEGYGKNGKAGAGFNSDVKSFITELKNANSTLDTTALETAINNYIVYSRQDGTRPKATGTAIFDLNNKEHFDHGTYSQYRTATNTWYNFVKAFRGAVDAGSGQGKPTVQATTTSGAPTVAGFGLKVVDPCADGKCFVISDDSGIKKIKTVKAIQEAPNTPRYILVGSEDANKLSSNTYRAANWDGQVLMLDGVMVPTELDDTMPDGTKVYITDCLYNGQDAFLKIRVDTKGNVIKALITPFQAMDNGDVRMSKDQFTIKTGDTLQFYDNVLDTDADSDDEWNLGTELTVTNGTFSWGTPQGTPFIFMLAEDVSGNIQNTDITPLNPVIN